MSEGSHVIISAHIASGRRFELRSKYLSPRQAGILMQVEGGPPYGTVCGTLPGYR